MKFNVNNHVRVRLTDYGREMLRLKYEKMANMHPNLNFYRRVPDEDELGWSIWQLWDLMNKLGEYCSLGSDPPFETEIELDV